MSGDPRFALDPEVREEVQAWSETTREETALAARKDLYFMAKGVLGYPDVNLETHGPICRFVTEDERWRRLTLYPRDTLKTTLCVISDGVRIGVDNPEARIGVFGETDTKAVSMVSAIQTHFERGEMLRFLFPDLIHENFNARGVDWSEGWATLPRNGVYPEPTYMAKGRGAAITGYHFTHMKADDLIGFESRLSTADLDHAIKWNDNLEAQLDTPKSDPIDWSGTRYGVNDLYAHIMEFYGEALGVLTRGAIENGQPIFPQKFDLAYYDRLRENDPEQYYAQHENNPIEGGSRDFTRRPHEFWFDEQGRVAYREGDAIRTWRLEDLDRTLQADPAGDRLRTLSAKKRKNDLAAVTVTGVSPKQQVFVLASESGRYTPTEYVDKIFQMARRWNVRIVGIEQVSLATSLHYFEVKMRRERTYLRTEPLRPKNRNKEDYIRTVVQPIVGTGRLYLLKSQRTLRSQLDFFPNIKEDGEINCLAYGSELWRTPLAVSQAEKTAEAHKRILARRNPRTGY